MTQPALETKDSTENPMVKDPHPNRALMEEFMSTVQAPDLKCTDSASGHLPKLDLECFQGTVTQQEQDEAARKQAEFESKMELAILNSGATIENAINDGRGRMPIPIVQLSDETAAKFQRYYDQVDLSRESYNPRDGYRPISLCPLTHAEQRAMLRPEEQKVFDYLEKQGLEVFIGNNTLERFRPGYAIDVNLFPYKPPVETAGEKPRNYLPRPQNDNACYHYIPAQDTSPQKMGRAYHPQSVPGREHSERQVVIPPYPRKFVNASTSEALTVNP